MSKSKAVPKHCRQIRSPAFGKRAPRFGKITCHPGLDPTGIFSARPAACDPCLYHPRPIHEQCQKKNELAKDPWRYKAELEDWCNNLGYRNQKILERKRWYASLLGPAWHEVKELGSYQPACKNVTFGRTPRMKSLRSDTPGPGFYYTLTPFKAPYGPHSTKPSFEFGEPCRFKDSTRSWSLAPDRYTIIDKDAIDQLSNKVVSLRGPYDLSSGPRDKSIKRLSAATWPYYMGGCLERYKKTHYGKMNKTGRDHPDRGRLSLVDQSMCVREPSEPGPANLNLLPPREFKDNRYGFNSSYDRAPGYQRAVVWPAVGRYTIKDLRCGIAGQGHRHVFLCKQKRTIGAIIPEPMNTF